MHGTPVDDPRAEGRAASWLNLGGNTLIAGAQLLVGFLFQTQALIADGLHNLGDIFHTAIAWVGFRIAEKPADEDHPYGHGNAESVAGILIGFILLGTGFLAGYRGVESLIQESYVKQGWESLVTAVLCGGLKEVLARRSIRVGDRLNSPTLIAVGHDQRADVLTAGGTVVGIVGAMLGFPILDAICAVLIGLYVVSFNALPVLKSNFDVLMDAAPRTDLADRIRKKYERDREVTRIDSIRIHPLGPYYEIDLEISVDGNLPVREGHAIAHRVRDELLRDETHVREVKIHVNPYPNE